MIVADIFLPRVPLTAHPIEEMACFGCSGLAVLWYTRPMNYTSADKPVPESIAASLARSEAQIAAGQTVPLEPVLDRLRASMARMQATRS